MTVVWKLVLVFTKYYILLIIMRKKKNHSENNIGNTFYRKKYTQSLTPSLVVTRIHPCHHDGRININENVPWDLWLNISDTERSRVVQLSVANPLALKKTREGK